MFKTAYTAMFQNISPAESVCQQVLAAMQAEEARQIPTILPVKRTENRRPVWTLVACAAMVTAAVALTWVLMRGEKPPVLPGGAPTVGTESTTVSTTVTTTVENSLPPSSVTHTSTLTESTTAPTTEPSQSSTTVTTTATTTTTTTTAATSTTITTTESTTVIGTLPTVGGYDDLFQWVEGFTTMEPTFSSTDPTTSSGTDKDSPTISKDTSSTTEPTSRPIYSSTSRPSNSGYITSGTTRATSATTTQPTQTTQTTQPTPPSAGTVSYKDKTTSNTSQTGDKVKGQLKNNKVALFSLYDEGPEAVTVVTPPLDSTLTVKEFALCGDRLVILAGRKEPQYADMTRVFVYDIEDPTSPCLLEEVRQDGHFLAAHLVDNTLYLMSYYVPENIQPNRPDTYIPRIYQQNTPTLLTPQQIIRAPQPSCNGYTVMTAISLGDAPAVTSALALFGQSNRHVAVYDTSVSILSNPYLNGQNQPVTDQVNIAWDKGQIYFISRTTKEA